MDRKRNMSLPAKSMVQTQRDNEDEEDKDWDGGKGASQRGGKTSRA